MVSISFAAETIFHLGTIPVTNSILMSWITMAMLIILGVTVSFRHVSSLPGRLQNAGEMVVETALDFFTEVLGSRKDAERIFPFVFTFFIFILLSNWLGLVPGIGSIGFVEHHIAEGSVVEEVEEVFVPFLRSTYSDLNMTLALAIISVVATHILGIAAIGFFKHAGKYITFKSPVLFFIGILELVAEVAKILSFSFRLFGNIFAGEVLLVVILGLVPFLAPVPFFALEIFVGFIQALVFSMLTLVFIKVAMMETEHA
jgi:F-type H+-transporting ATPase subunit a